MTMSNGDFSHGGDLLKMAEVSGHAPEDLVDFSVNVNPSGLPDFIRAALWGSLEKLAPYPPPHAEDAAACAAERHGLDAACFVPGNGSNELIHALPGAFTPAEGLIAEPAFSEYRLACLKAGIPVRSLVFGEKSGFRADPKELASSARTGGMVFLANPGNPSGVLLDRDELLEAVTRRQDVLWILDEAFIDYVGEEASLVNMAAALPNLMVLRSLTKFYGMAGLRTGYAVACPAVAERLRAALPAWNVSTCAAEAMKAVFREGGTFADKERCMNAERRDDLERRLDALPGVVRIPSSANYVLFRWPYGGDLARKCLVEHGIALRDCSNYEGLSGGVWFRAAVRFPEDHKHLVRALSGYVCGNDPGEPSRVEFPVPVIKKRVPALMLQGTCSDAGKSVLTSAFGRILVQDGYAVAPFKAQNMALNSGVTALGEEMGRAQMVQARACRKDPDARMNPVLLKPHSDMGSQIVLMGHPVGNMDAREYYRHKSSLWPTVCEAYDSLSRECDVMVLEGAGSPGEVNLKSVDIVNMSMARYAGASVLLTGDIDRGGVYASFLGTWMTFDREERELLGGFLVNKFRGDASLLGPAHDYIQARTGVPVVGIVPMIRSLNIPEEDRATFSFQSVGGDVPVGGVLDVAVVMLRHVSNYTDFAPLAEEPDIRLRQVRTADEFGSPDWVILPGSKNVAHDFETLEAAGLAELIRRHAASGKWVLGICGGLQMLGRTIEDPSGIESSRRSFSGLGLLDLETTFERDKILTALHGVTTPLGRTTSGYEIHHGRSRAGSGCEPLFFRPDGSACGYGTGRVWATYLHGVFEDDEFRRAMIDRVRTDAGLKPAGRILVRCDLDGALDRLADIVRESVDLKAIYRSMGLA
jgi:adenosylcobyric acid synthase